MTREGRAVDPGIRRHSQCRNPQGVSREAAGSCRQAHGACGTSLHGAPADDHTPRQRGIEMRKQFSLTGGFPANGVAKLNHVYGCDDQVVLAREVLVERPRELAGG